MWWNASAEAIRWGVIAGIVLLFLLAFTGAHLHAKRRMKNGKAPLPYHRVRLIAQDPVS